MAQSGNSSGDQSDAKLLKLSAGVAGCPILLVF